MIVVAPVDTPFISAVVPVKDVTAAIPADALLHVPLEVLQYNVVLLPEHTVDTPVIAEGTGPTVTTCVLAQPLPVVYDMVATPADTPVTTPELFTVAFDGLLLLHAPPPVLHANASVLPVHTALPPVIAAGIVFTVATADLKQ